MIEGIAAGMADAAGIAAAKPKDDPAKVQDAARQFEALLLAQMMKSVREADSESWLGTGEDQAGQSAMALAEEHFAAALSKTGGLGLSDLIVAGLNRPR